MKSVKLFGQFFLVGLECFSKIFSAYLASFIAFLILDLLTIIPWTSMGYENNSFYEIVISIITALLGLVVVANVILIEKSRLNDRAKEALLYAAPTYLIYTLYSSLLVLAGLVCLIIPGVFALILLSLAPMASILIENDNVNYFKLSYRMVRQNVVLVTCFVAVTFLLELPDLILSFIPSLVIKLSLLAIYSFIDSALVIVLAITSVHVFYHLKKSLDSQQML